MHSPLVIAAAAVALALSASTPSVDAYGKYVKLLPNGGDIPDTPNCGHIDPAGQEGVNDFGKAFKKFGNTWNKNLCMADSDGDGFTNGQEMGDPCCTWTPTNTAGLITEGISHPSDKTKTPTNPKLTAGCSSGGTSTSTTPAPAGGSTTTAPGGSATPSTGKTETVDDVLAPVSATSSPTSGTYPADDDEDDSDESAVLASAPASVAQMSMAVLVVCASALVALVF